MLDQNKLKFSYQRWHVLSSRKALTYLESNVSYYLCHSIENSISSVVPSMFSDSNLKPSLL